MVPSTRHRVFPISQFMCAPNNRNFKLQVIYRRIYQATASLSGSFLVFFRVEWEIWLESYDSGYASVVFWYIIVSAEQNSRICTLWLHTIYLTTAFLTPMHCFIRATLPGCSTHCVSFQLMVYASVTIQSRRLLYKRAWLCNRCRQVF